MKENQNIEWKPSWPDECLKWICDFANAGGGTLVIGRNVRGEALGVLDATRLLEEIPNTVREVLGIMVDVNLLHEGGRELLEICVKPCPRPVSYNSDANPTHLEAAVPPPEWGESWGEKWGDNWVEKWGKKWGGKVTAKRLRIVLAMRNNPFVTTLMLAAELGVASTSGVEKHLKALREAGCIRRIGPAKGGQWEVLDVLQDLP